MRRQQGTKAKDCDSEVDLTYELSAWYEPLLMVDLVMKMKFEIVCGVVNGLVDVFDDDCGWIRESGRWKKVGISSLLKKVMIRQARAVYALVDFTCLMCWN